MWPGRWAPARTGIWLVDESGEWLEPFMAYHLPTGPREANRHLRLRISEHEFYAEPARTLRSVVSTDVMNDPRIPDVVRQLVPHRTQLFVPIVAKDRMVGGFAVSWRDRVRGARGQRAAAHGGGGEPGGGGAGERAALPRQCPARGRAVRAPRAVARGDGTARPRRAWWSPSSSRWRESSTSTTWSSSSTTRRRTSWRSCCAWWTAPSTPAGRAATRAMAWGSCRWCWTPAAPSGPRDYLAECARRGVDVVARAAEVRHWLGRAHAGGGSVPRRARAAERPSASSPPPTSISSAISPTSPPSRSGASRLFEERTARLRRARRRPGPARPHREAARAGRDGVGGGPRLQQCPRRHRGPRPAPPQGGARPQAPALARGDRALGPGRSADGAAAPGVHPHPPRPAGGGGEPQPGGGRDAREHGVALARRGPEPGRRGGREDRARARSPAGGRRSRPSCARR